jgi:hypothetical protein
MKSGEVGAFGLEPFGGAGFEGLDKVGDRAGARQAEEDGASKSSDQPPLPIAALQAASVRRGADPRPLAWAEG